ncbi:MAG: SDR family NAD(P)-dependent oxidoreductase [Caulobacterales bacterium]|jgi:NAD(P)-dependent dehydrogenase (short-subunit alcohol dehydrogenase family)
MSGKLAGKAAVITGAASGIGAGMVERFIAEGAMVLACDIQDEKGRALEARFPGKLAFQHCDVMAEDAIAAAMKEAVARFGRLDIVCNNAGAGGAMSGALDADLADWKRTFDLLYFSVVAGTKHAALHMKDHGGGAIINTSSISAVEAGWAPPCYSTAKIAVAHFSKVAAGELAPHHIRINAILPGFIATSIFGASLGMERNAADQMGAMLAQTGGALQPMGRVGRPSDIAGMAAFLASDDGEWITGSHFVVDGGITIGPRHAWDLTAPSPVMEALGISPEQAEAMRAALTGAKP